MPARPGSPLVRNPWQPAHGGSHRPPNLAAHTMCLRAGAAQLPDRALLFQMCQEYFGKEVMIAIPVAPVIQWNDKEIASLQGLQLHVSFILAGDGIAQRAIQPVENGGPK